MTAGSVDRNDQISAGNGIGSRYWVVGVSGTDAGAPSKSYGERLDARWTLGSTALPGFGLVSWTARELTLPDGSVFATILDAAITSDGSPLSAAGRDGLVFWESTTA
jgi:hypothetical protein